MTRAGANDLHRECLLRRICKRHFATGGCEVWSAKAKDIIIWLCAERKRFTCFRCKTTVNSPPTLLKVYERINSFSAEVFEHLWPPEDMKLHQLHISYRLYHWWRGSASALVPSEWNMLFIGNEARLWLCSWWINIWYLTANVTAHPATMMTWTPITPTW